ncbi:Fur family transcriptional regulator [Jeotgalibaca ciconiae]|uniref:Transcriptional repressor n=1 Tax=Jeotgalibaca ciconiae TaxID=2496265 RepID=A0A3S9HC81_9LACT|nr:Fur family transcriptional regulator [Jeotgalibaca ciconiae]AZP04978.1 transcriptional repressor [Jeotgalibaca ciconiae]HJB23426.1 transcriptional repressor [Candidatus Jeotgalibaca pullicola]
MVHSIVTESLNKLRNEKIRITPQREAILEYMAESDKHPTAEEIYRALYDQFPNMSQATVYNNLHLFVKIGFVKELSYRDTSSRFDFTNTQHYHAICEKCGAVVDLYYPVLDDIEMVAKSLIGFEVSHHKMEVYGTCPDCLEKEIEAYS